MNALFCEVLFFPWCLLVATHSIDHLVNGVRSHLVNRWPRATSFTLSIQPRSAKTRQLSQRSYIAYANDRSHERSPPLPRTSPSVNVVPIVSPQLLPIRTRNSIHLLKPRSAMTRELSQRLYSEAITTRCNDRSRALLGIVLFSQHGLTVAIHLGYIWRGGYTLRRHISWFSCIVKKNFIAFSIITEASCPFSSHSSWNPKYVVGGKVSNLGP